ncbi:Hpt domain-containing protein [Butyrivibrio sp. NC2002]|uniref:Hpt domain-containing protein n=1 Tax=Butyrivibrio sp. NC2002 TaxID=1410610 RepID=UPI00068CDC44|nr:Hpt domain-containing protein [Butyrivibrio sp. NC2002]
MDERMKQELIEWGVTWDELSDRFLGNEALMTRFMFKFLTDTSFADLSKYLNDKNAEEAFKACHTLKGVTSNLSLDAMKKEVMELTEILRAGSLEGSEELFKTIEVKYNSLMTILKKYAD